tara:strand:+ start:152 stop:427 length:276 start_codon:yes stop_codon:yes gene_type:complete
LFHKSLPDCKSIKKIVTISRNNGNSVERIEDGWSAVKSNVKMKKPMKFNTKKLIDQKTNNLDHWINNDSHYPSQEGYLCHECKISISFPLK